MPVPISYRIRRYRLQLIVLFIFFVLILHYHRTSLAQLDISQPHKNFLPADSNTFNPHTPTDSDSASPNSPEKLIDTDHIQKQIEILKSNPKEISHENLEAVAEALDEADAEDQRNNLKQQARLGSTSNKPKPKFQDTNENKDSIAPPKIQIENSQQKKPQNFDNSKFQNADPNQVNPKGQHNLAVQDPETAPTKVQSPQAKQGGKPPLPKLDDKVYVEPSKPMGIPPPVTNRKGRTVPKNLSPTFEDFLKYQIVSNGGGNTRLPDDLPGDLLTPVGKLPRIDNFPVSNIIPLPKNGVKLPKIQAQTFASETKAQKTERLRRLQIVKDAFRVSWNQYKTFAWGKDEIKPVTQIGVNPFAGWAATMVDALDTLIIMDLKDEFKEAVKFISTINFATTFRHEIPLFETVIRYLGGLLSAYDLTQKSEPILLQKAIELADNLMGAFDTPNRMPLLQYKWEDSERKFKERAGAQASVAEVGSLSLEFTRLAQLSGNNTYYDAIARITQAFERLAPNLEKPYLFPLMLDTSGCELVPLDSDSVAQLGIARNPNSDDKQDAADSVQSLSVPAAADSTTDPSLNSVSKSVVEDSDKSVENAVKRSDDSPTSILLSFSDISASTNILEDETIKPSVSTDLAATSTTSKSSIPLIKPPKQKKSVAQETDSTATTITNADADITTNTVDPSENTNVETPQQGSNKIIATDLGVDTEADASSVIADEDASTANILKKRDVDLEAVEEKEDSTTTKKENTSKIDKKQQSETHINGNLPVIAVYQGQGVFMGCKERDVYPFDVIPNAKLSFGGLVDSTYEYYLKEHILLNGADPAYEKLYINTIEAAEKNNMLFRPLAEGDPDVLFLGDLIRGSSNFYQYDNVASHLTCFVGGMWALGSKVFNRPKDLETAAKLTDGCVYAYNITRTGIMGESMSFRRCPTEPGVKCHFDFETVDQVASRENQYLLKRARERGANTKNYDAISQFLKPEGVLLPDEKGKERWAVRASYDQPRSVLSMDPRYLLRPEAIESVFYMYRISGDSSWQDKGWNMISSILEATKIEDSNSGKILGYSGIYDVTDDRKLRENFANIAESFWLAETLKYAYLLYSEPELISLDKYVFNTEAHPLERQNV